MNKSAEMISLTSLQNLKPTSIKFSKLLTLRVIYDFQLIFLTNKPSHGSNIKTIIDKNKLNFFVNFLDSVEWF